MRAGASAGPQGARSACPACNGDWGGDGFEFGGDDMSIDDGWTRAELNAEAYDANFRDAQIAGSK